jgi:hypothetical protein
MKTDDITSPKIDTDCAASGTASSDRNRKKRTKTIVPDAERWAFSVDEAAAKAGFSRAKMWSLLAAGVIKRRQHGGRTWITAADLREFLTNPPVTQ